MRIVLDNGAILDVFWDGEKLLIEDKYLLIDDFDKAVLNYSSHDEFFIDIMTKILEKAGFVPVKFYGDWRV